MRKIPSKKNNRRLLPFLLEQLESRLCLTAVCTANPTYEAECTYLDNLIQPSDITLTAVQSGNWSNPATWGGRLPGNGDNVWIPHGITVTVDTQESGALRSILDNGVLTFTPNVNTSLTVNTIVVGTDNNPTGVPEGELDIGTASHPIQAGVTAQLIFADLGPQSQLFPNDWQQLSGGLISMGALNIYGSQVTPWVNMNNAAAGDTILTLTTQPVGWKVGDTLLIPGTVPGTTEDEQIQIAAIQNNANGTTTVTLATPLQYAHAAPNGQSVQVADENRSVVLESQDVTNQDGAAGQVMEMHNDACSVQYAALLDLGRTNKAVPLNNAQLDSNGNLIPGTGTNEVGRYALHFHRCYWPSINGKDPPIQVVGNFEMGSPGWGYVNHSSNVDFIDNVGYNNFGASFVSQAGNELGTFQNNLSINTPGVPSSFNQLRVRANVQDFGWNGAGFWLTSPSTSVIGNHVWEAQIGYAEYTNGLIDDALGLTKTWSGASANFVPMAAFSGNTAAEVTEGLNITFRQADAAHPSVIDHFAAWDVTSYGIDIAYFDRNVVVQNSTLQGAPGTNDGIVASSSGYAFNLTAANDTVTGFAVGFAGIPSSQETVQGGYWDDTTAFSLPAASLARQVFFQGAIQFGPNVVTQYAIRPFNYAQFVSAAGNPSAATGFPNSIFAPDQIILPDGNQLYTWYQAADFVPFPVGSVPNLPAALVGLTNAQIYQQFGIAIGGFVGPKGGGEARAQPIPAFARLASPYQGQIGTAYSLKYEINPPVGKGTYVTDAKPVYLAPGWNVLTEGYHGTSYSWLVFGSIFSCSTVPNTLVGVPYNQSITVPPGYTLSMAVTSGAIPAGLTFTINGNVLTITGTATAAGSVTFSLTATDASGWTISLPFTLTAITPINVSAQISWTSSAITYNRGKGLYTATITLTNNGTTALNSTLLAVLTGLPSGVTLANSSGTLNGIPFVPISLSRGPLAAGASVTFVVRFKNPVGVPISFGVSTYEK